MVPGRVQWLAAVRTLLLEFDRPPQLAQTPGNFCAAPIDNDNLLLIPSNDGNGTITVTLQLVEFYKKFYAYNMD